MKKYMSHRSIFTKWTPHLISTHIKKLNLSSAPEICYALFRSPLQWKWWQFLSLTPWLYFNLFWTVFKNKHKVWISFFLTQNFVSANLRLCLWKLSWKSLRIIAMFLFRLCVWVGGCLNSCLIHLFSLECSTELQIMKKNSDLSYLLLQYCKHRA